MRDSFFPQSFSIFDLFLEDGDSFYFQLGDYLLLSGEQIATDFDMRI